ncbi:energy transducer TonB [Primorskyibacter flagellatus]|uniref:Outer membrane transport energization protein TonB n=1 Tax=Primorskyibacter flagellatus TaxID=1387277 RepID=A0A1W2EE12_9RHOB|nr:energy transducer TonB [Primorskyibacter flagellatus]SMD07984.1 outer membrane transport energization protein TonB [Primorskyibacter flagellatus]
MISTSRSVKLACVLLAASAHAALALALMTNDPVRTEGAPGSADVQLGSSFADMAAGTMTNESVEKAIQPDSAARPLQPDQATPSPGERLKVTKAAPPETTLPNPDAITKAVQPAPPSPLTVPVAPLTPSSTIQATRQTAAPPRSSAPTSREMIKAEATNATAVARSLRPMARSREVEEKAQQQAEAEKATKPKQTEQPRGNSQRNARAGATTGTRTAKSKSSGSGGKKSSASGNAAVSNYPGVVMSCVSRSGRPNVRGRGTTRVSFSVANNGRITNVALAGASGNSRLDRAALDLVRRVRSCPPPPAGARRSFSIGISAR